MRKEQRRIGQVVDALIERTGARREDVRVVRSPLRVCPLGAHIDHQLGVVTGWTLDQAVLLAFVPRADRGVRVGSLDFDGRVEYDLDAIGAAQPGDWGNYPRGAGWVMTHADEARGDALAWRDVGALRRGMDAVVSGPLPIGGLSSSAAVDVAYLLGLQAANGLVLPALQNIRLAQRIENDYIGLNNGILDQSIILGSRRGQLTRLDCRDWRFDHIEPLRSVRFNIVVAYSGLSRVLVGTDYNQRVAECGEAAQRLLDRAGLPCDTPRLREVPREVFEAHRAELPDKPRRRAEHFFGEMARVDAGVDAWRRGNLAELGRLMCESGRSSIDLYESGSPHLITLHDILNSTPGVYGARFSGAGFRGSCIALCDADARESILAAVGNRYPKAHPDVAHSYSLHFCSPAGPAELL